MELKKRNYNPADRESVYDDDLPAKMIQYFDRKPYEYVKTADGNIATDKFGKPVTEPVDLPTFSKFATDLGVDRTTLYYWEKKHEQFARAMDICRDLQRNTLIQNGLKRNYDPSFSRFVAINLTDMRNKAEMKHTGEFNLGDLFSESEKIEADDNLVIEAPEDEE